jgi:hypothetical protein
MLYGISLFIITNNISLETRLSSMLTRDKSAKNLEGKANEKTGSIRRSSRSSSKPKPNNMVDIDEDEECNADID